MAISSWVLSLSEADAHERKVRGRVRLYFGMFGLLIAAWILAGLIRSDTVFFAATLVAFPVGLIAGVRLWFVMRRDIELRGGYSRFGAGFLALMPYAVIAWLIWRRSHPIRAVR